MGGFADERAAAESHFAARFSSTPVAYEGVPFPQPKASAWVQMTILSGRGIRVDSTNWQRHAGIVQIDVFAPEKTGQKEARDLADAIASTFRERQIVYGSSVLTFGTPGFETPEDTSEKGWMRIVVNAPFQRDAKG